MNYGEVKELLDKGFTAEEIRGFMAAEPKAAEPEQKAAEPEQKAAEPEQKAAEPDNNPQNPQNNPQDFNEKFVKLSDTVDKLIKVIQGNNRLNDSFNKPGEQDLNKQVDDIMASIIRPEHKKGE